MLPSKIVGSSALLQTGQPSREKAVAADAIVLATGSFTGIHFLPIHGPAGNLMRDRAVRYLGRRSAESGRGCLSCADDETIHNEPVPIEPEMVVAAMKVADLEGKNRSHQGVTPPA